MILKWVLLCALVLSVSADRPQWRKLEGDLEPEPEVELFQEVNEAYRLPKISVPSHYNLHLWTAIHENNRQFQGTVEIFVNVLELTDTITILNRQLSIWKVTLYSVTEDDQSPIELGAPEYATDSTTEHLSIKHSSALQPGSYMVKVEYYGALQNNNNQGFFASSYLDDDGNRHYLASSKFEPTHARSAFPCFDEPKLKATFTLSITHHKEYNAVANMPQDGAPVPDVDDPNYITTKFQKSTKMSTYLLAFAVSNFRIRTSGIHTVYARPNVYEETEYPLQAGVDILNALSDYTGVDYIKYMPKMTQIAIPDRGSGAMENWGLVTYGEPVLLFNPSINTYRTKKSVATIIAHEFSHQWFGNLVSPDWWDYIWLNEGFATVYEYYAAQLAYPETHYWDLWNVEVIHNAFAADARETVRPMTWNAASPSEIAGLFDTVAYDKSGSVLNMFRVVFQDDNWREGLVSYFNNRELDGAIADHLYEGLQLAVNGKDVLPRSFNVKDVMDSWTTVAGFPVLTVKRDYKTGEIYVSQERFYSDRQLPNDHVYHVPYNYATKSAANFDTLTFEWLSTKAAKLMTTAAAGDWIIFNKQQTGYYRVNYDAQNWQLIINALQDNPSTIHVQNRAQLINDAYNLARSERLDLAVPLELMTYLRQETAYPPWAAASSVLTYFNNKIRGTPKYHNFMNYTTHLVETIYSTLSVDSVSESETVMDKYLKQTITTWACRIGNQDCLTRTGNALRQAVESNTPIHPDIASVVYCYGLHTTTNKEFVWMFERLLASKNQAERALLIDSLGCSQNKEFLYSFLMTSIGNGATFNFLATERTRIVSSVYSASRVGVDATIEFLADETMIDEFISRLGQSTLNNAVSNIASRTNNVVEEDQLNTLLAALGDKISVNTANSARTTVANNFAWFHSLEGLVADEFFGHYLN
ncbi:aminopeptidase N-like [Ochlerotatus camptorhynchus]|uniref:aminopeptidase N-like n=1 Tax=Ochlerotatus camptorhynchus TaxID=644619 RepID=UPI0031D97F35